MLTVLKSIKVRAVVVALSCPLTSSRTELHPSPHYSTQSPSPAQTDAHDPTLRRETQTNMQPLTQPQRNKQSWGQTARDPQTQTLCSPHAGGCVYSPPQFHIVSRSHRKGLWEPRCHFLCPWASTNHHQIRSSFQPITIPHDGTPTAISVTQNCLDLEFPCFPPKIVVWRQGSFCFGIIRVSFISSSVPLDLRPPGSRRRISHSSVPHNVAFREDEEGHSGLSGQEREEEREPYRSIIPSTGSTPPVQAAASDQSPQSSKRPSDTLLSHVVGRINSAQPVPLCTQPADSSSACTHYIHATHTHLYLISVM
ncbi:hypothetical protein Q8A67_021129 [Cirrhinus molitorella]|uniref:Uncharacterized protein n=1 Tax=Cirrhinus molitorella TaxID=172907 RepID=A0AA88PGY7_9TELE|nr:hypothetical protein Q8A67_021129 [Cirrhinus molitorella]